MTPHTCQCGYVTVFRSNLTRHRNRCRVASPSNSLEELKAQLLEKDAEINKLKEALATKEEPVGNDAVLKEKDDQLKVRDKQIRELTRALARPATNVNVTFNVFEVGRHAEGVRLWRDEPRKRVIDELHDWNRSALTAMAEVGA